MSYPRVTVCLIRMKEVSKISVLKEVSLMSVTGTKQSLIWRGCYVHYPKTESAGKRRKNQIPIELREARTISLGQTKSFDR